MSGGRTGEDGDGVIFTQCVSGDVPDRPHHAGELRRCVVVRGRRVKTIDMHAHAIIPKACALLGQDTSNRPFPGNEEVGTQRLAAMDSAGIDIEVISINPAWYSVNTDLALEVCRINNETLAELSARHRERFLPFASVPLQKPQLAVEELEYAVKKLGMKGVAVGASCGGADFSDPKFHPFWSKCEALGVVIFVHPQGMPALSTRFKGNGWLSNVIGNPLETTICLSKLIFEGTLDKFPGLKILVAHGGGYLPSYASRSDQARRVAPWAFDAHLTLKKKPSEYLRTLYYDTMVFTAEMLRHLAAEVGSDRLVMGTDYPIPWEPDPVTHILEAPGFTAEERVAILGGTAAMLLGLS